MSFRVLQRDPRPGAAILSWLLVACVAGCSVGASPADLPAADPGRDPGDTQPALDLPPDVAAELDEAEAELLDYGPPPKGFLESCTTNDECASGFCVPFMGDTVCTQTCLEACPAGWRCRAVQGIGGDVIYICASDYWALCQPCQGNEDCRSQQGQNENCLKYGPSGRFCGGRCQKTEDCPEGYDCAQTESVLGVATLECVRAKGECPCTQGYVQSGVKTVCEVSNSYGTCRGERWCTGAGLTPCPAATPAPEVCDRVDNDCDGQTDEGLPACCVCGNGKCEKACEDIFSCPEDCTIECGNKKCDLGENPSNCPEDCCGGCGDGVCTGYACGENTTTCKADCGTACGNHVCDKGETPQSCAEDCKWKYCGNRVCDPEDGGPLGCPEDCAATCGNCECEGGENWLTCPIDCGYCGDGTCSPCAERNETPTTCPQDCSQGIEVCNGKDDDGDGHVDEEGAAGCQPYHLDEDSDGHGVAAKKCLCAPLAPYTAPDETDCNDKDPAVHPGATEICNGVDDNCDGTIDEMDAQGCVAHFLDVDKDGFGSATNACLCEPSGFYTAMFGGDCNDNDPSVNPAAAELCNGRDDNCNGSTDEGLACQLCKKDLDCPAGQHCDPDGDPTKPDKDATPLVCQVDRADGASSNEDSDCVSGHSEGGWCCAAGECCGGIGDCDDGDACTTDACDAAAWECRHVPVGCDDGEPCTEDACDSGTGECHHAPFEGTPCDDGDDCTVGDWCHQGACLGGGPRNCGDLDQACGTGACDPVRGACILLPKLDGTPCNADGLACTVDQCHGGTCQAGSRFDCSSLDGECRLGRCQEGISGPECIQEIAADGAPCATDGDPCTLDRCAAGACGHVQATVCPGAPCGGKHPFDAGDEQCGDEDACAGGIAGAGLGTCTAVCPDCQVVASGPIALPISAKFGPTVATLHVTTALAFVDAVQVKVRISHPALGDLSIVLVDPQGHVHPLSKALGGAHADLADTFDASLPVPYPGFPTSGLPLCGLRGEAAAGDWKLVVTDGTPSGDGLLREWKLFVRASDSPDLNPGHRCEDALPLGTQDLDPAVQINGSTECGMFSLADSCGDTGPQRFYRLEIGVPKRLTVTLPQPARDLLLFVTKVDGSGCAPSALACQQQGANWTPASPPEVLELALEPGAYVLGIGTVGTEFDAGPFGLQVRLKTRLGNGAPCPGASSAPDCLSGTCADGVCCENACGGTCERCDLPGRAGFCDPVPAGSDPDDECAAEPAFSCGHTGACSGQRTCALDDPGAPCGVPACMDVQTSRPAPTCDGAGTCLAGALQTCEPYLCVPLSGACRTACTARADCAPGYDCADDGACRKDLGQACLSGAECASGACQDVCVSGKVPNGTACQATKDCESGHCQNGFCCSQGDCCTSAIECPARMSLAGYWGPAVCDDATTCQGHRTDATCVDYVCGSVPVDDDSTCNGTVVSNDCGFFLAALCGTVGGNPPADQGQPACLPACTSDAQCDANAHCDPNPGNPAVQTCGADLGNGEVCDEASDCVSGYCQSGYCCNAGGCCQACKVVSGVVRAGGAVGGGPTAGGARVDVRFGVSRPVGHAEGTTFKVDLGVLPQAWVP